ncbi:hypothetical protein Ae331Ps2_6349c [Pseudonocardia sp. Ae331_Ps2]|nr:hypothetical protein Ae331Ps2_6349c [Pseudonocardia sp. Ae331_Ps2]
MPAKHSSTTAPATTDGHSSDAAEAGTCRSPRTS